MNLKELYAVFSPYDDVHPTGIIESVWILESDATKEADRIKEVLSAAGIPRIRKVGILQDTLFAMYKAAYNEGFQDGVASIKDHTEDDERL